MAIVIGGTLALAGVPVPPAHAAQPIRIGFGMPLTGALAGGGKASLLSMQIWAEDVNKSGGLLGRPVELVYYDDQSKPANVPVIYSKLLDVDKVDFVVSSYGTAVISAALPLVMERGLVFMGLGGTGVNEKFKYSNYFQIMPMGPDPRRNFSTGFFEVVKKLNPKPQTIALLAEDAEFATNAVHGARENAKEAGLKTVYDKTYPPGTTDLTPVVRSIKALNPDIVFVGSYPPGSVGIIQAVQEVGLKPKVFGGAMVGLQFAAIQAKLGPMLNGIVNFDFWVPEPTLKFPGIDAFLQKYQARAPKLGVDPYGHYIAPWAYAYVQVLGEAVAATKSLDQKKIADYIRSHAHDAIVGKVKFGPNGEWLKSRTLQVQFQNVKDNAIEQFREPGKRVVLWPEEWKSGELIYPYAKAK
ncbi:MAG: amino acid ABC transporter substrate-binding protein [Nitrospinota bacterium]